MTDAGSSYYSRVLLLGTVCKGGRGDKGSENRHHHLGTTEYMQGCDTVLPKELTVELHKTENSTGKMKWHIVIGNTIIP